VATKAVMALASGGMDKLTVGGIILSGAVAQDLEVDIYLLLGGAYAFRKGTAENLNEVAEFAHVKDEFMAGLARAKVPYWLDLFKKAKELGNVKIHACGTAGKIWGAEKLEDFVDLVDDICGISEYISAVEEADLSFLL
jgi:peroxiredoxin family protein